MQSPSNPSDPSRPPATTPPPTCPLQPKHAPVHSPLLQRAPASPPPHQTPDSLKLHAETAPTYLLNSLHCTPNNPPPFSLNHTNNSPRARPPNTPPRPYLLRLKVVHQPLRLPGKRCQKPVRFRRHLQPQRSSTPRQIAQGLRLDLAARARLLRLLHYLCQHTVQKGSGLRGRH